MAITVQYSPDAQLVAQAAMTAGQGDYNRWAAQQALQQQELQQQKDLTFFNAANQQYQQRIGILDTQHRQTQQIQASQTEQLRNIANQQGLAQYDAYNTNYRFAGGIANEQYLQDERIAYQDRSDIRGIEAQNQRTTQALEMERLNTLSKLQAQQQSQQFEAQQRMASQFLDGQQRAGLMQLQAGLSSQQRQAEQSFDIARMNYAKKNQLDIASTLADKEFRQKNFLGEYADHYETLSQREFEGSMKGIFARRDQALKWLSDTGLGDDPNIRKQVEWNLSQELMGVKARAPVFTDAEWKFKGGLVEYGGTKYMATDRGFEALPDTTTKREEIRMRGINEVMSSAMESATKYADTIWNQRMEQLAEMGIVGEARRLAELEIAKDRDQAFKAHVEDRLRGYTSVFGGNVGDYAEGF